MPSYQGVTRRCRLSLLTNSASYVESKCGGEGGIIGYQPMSAAGSCAHHLTWSPNKLWRSTSIFNLCILLSREIGHEAIPRQQKSAVVFTSSHFHEAQPRDIFLHWRVCCKDNFIVHTQVLYSFYTTVLYECWMLIACRRSEAPLPSPFSSRVIFCSLVTMQLIYGLNRAEA
jgi:hypothetical protein